jgi:hypothetical protein
MLEIELASLTFGWLTTSGDWKKDFAKLSKA